MVLWFKLRSHLGKLEARMAGAAFPAMISNEPPPLDAGSEDEDSEDLGSALKLDLSEETTPSHSPAKLPFSPKSKYDHERNSSMKQDDIDQDYQEKCLIDQKLNDVPISSPDTDSNDPRVQTVGDSYFENTTDGEILNGCDEIADQNEIDNILYVKSGLESPAEVQACSNHEEFQVFLGDRQERLSQKYCGDIIHESGLKNCVETNSACEGFHSWSDSYRVKDSCEDDCREFLGAHENGTLSPLTDSGEAGFGAAGDSANGNINIINNPPISASPSPDDDFNNFATFSSSEDLDDFGDFSAATCKEMSDSSISHAYPEAKMINSCIPKEHSVPQDYSGSSSQFKSISKPLNDSEQGVSRCDFEFGSTSISGSSTHRNSFGEICGDQARRRLCIHSLFPSNNSEDEVPTKDSQCNESISFTETLDCLMGLDERWKHLKDFEASHCLRYKFKSSQARQYLLRSLNIDNSSIMYSEKWGAVEIPRFAASIIDSPLVPQTVHSKPTSSIPNGKVVFFEDNPDVCYPEPTSSCNAGRELCDSKPEPVSGDISEETSECKTVTGISSEAQSILKGLPDLSYMGAKTLVFPDENSNARKSTS